MVEEILSPSDRMAEPGGPMKTIFFGEAASDSGSLGFSEACPLAVSAFPRLDVSAAVQSTHHPAQTAWTSIRSAISTINSTLA